MTELNTKARIAGSLAYWDGKPASYCPFDRGTAACREWHAGYESTRDEVEGGTVTVPLAELGIVYGEPVG